MNIQEVRAWIRENYTVVGWNEGNIMPPIGDAKIRITPDGYVELDGDRAELQFEDLFWIIPFYGMLDLESQGNLHKWIKDKLGIEITETDILYMGNGIIMIDTGDTVYYLSPEFKVVKVSKEEAKQG